MNRVTGATGMLDNHIVERLRKRDRLVRVLSGQSPSRTVALVAGRSVL